MEKRYLVLIDGSNFYYKLKDLSQHNLLVFNFTNFNKYLAKGGSIIDAKYYIGKIKTDGTKKIKRIIK